MRPIPGGPVRIAVRVLSVALLASVSHAQTKTPVVVPVQAPVVGVGAAPAVAPASPLLRSVSPVARQALAQPALAKTGAKPSPLGRALRTTLPAAEPARSESAATALPLAAGAPETRWQRWLNEREQALATLDPAPSDGGSLARNGLRAPAGPRAFVEGRIYDRSFVASEKADGRFTVVLNLNDTIEHHDDKTGGDTFRLRPGIEGDLGRLKASGIKVVLWTQAERWWVERFLDRFPALAPQFDRIITHENYMEPTPGESVGRPVLASRVEDDPFAKDLSVLGYDVLIDDRSEARATAEAAGFTLLRVRPLRFDERKVDGDVTRAVDDALNLARLRELKETPDGDAVAVLDIEADRVDLEASLGPEPLAFAINRSIFTLDAQGGAAKIKRAAGGAAPAIYDALKSQGGGLVFAAAMTPLERSLARAGKILKVGEGAYLRYVDMPEDVFEKHYTGYANSILWPAQHGMSEDFAGGTPPDMQDEFERGYRVANRHFAREMRRVLGNGSRARLMVQDYHLYLLPGMLRRERATGGVVQQFVHIPWPEPEYIARAVPADQLRELMIGLLGNDIVGFQTPEFARRFLKTAALVLGADADVEAGRIRWAGREVWVRAYPISLDADAILNTLRSPAALDHMRRFEQVKAGKKLILRVDRMDPTKGILEGFEAYRRLLRMRPFLAGQVMFYGILQPSREGNAAYRGLQEKIRTIVREINREFSPESAARGFDGIVDGHEKHRAFLALAPHQVPAVTVRMTAVPNAEVLATMAVMDVGLVNSKADGMNLVAKEMAVANDPALLDSVRPHARRVRPGVIVASAKMGAFGELEGRAIELRNPNDLRETTQALATALAVSEAWSAKAALASRQVAEHNLAKWFAAMMKDVQARAPPAEQGRHAVAILDTPEKILYTRMDRYAKATRRLDLRDFIIRDDDASTIKLAALRAAADRGVLVRQLADDLHDELDPAMIVHLRERGVQVRDFNPFRLSRFWRIFIRYHEKGAGIDGVEDFAGDANTGDEYLQWGDHERMTSRDVLVKGPAARAAARHFDKLWDSAWVGTPEIRVASPEEVARHRRRYELRNRIIVKLFSLVGFKIDARGVFLKPRVRLVTREEVEAAGRRLDDAAARWREIAAHNWIKSRGYGPRTETPEEPIEVDRVGYVHDAVGKKGDAKGRLGSLVHALRSARPGKGMLERFFREYWRARMKPGMEENLLSMIRGAKDTLTITTPYLVLTPEFRGALQDAIRRRVKVTIITNSLESSDNAYTQAHYELRKRELAAMGLELWEYNGPGTLHAKSAVADGVWCFNGAYNVDYRSQTLSMENGHVWRSRRSARQFQSRLREDQENSTLIARDGRFLEVRVRRVRFGPWAYQLLAEKQL
ncbi:MAG: trehalose-6-phosphate synthase [Elusimicrobia bacterium]|nr:trehalose-6-phosphate synthase [Elusimicrobiota bacterium]